MGLGDGRDRRIREITTIATVKRQKPGADGSSDGSSSSFGAARIDGSDFCGTSDRRCRRRLEGYISPRFNA